MYACNKCLTGFLYYLHCEDFFLFFVEVLGIKLDCRLDSEVYMVKTDMKFRFSDFIGINKNFLFNIFYIFSCLSGLHC